MLIFFFLIYVVTIMDERYQTMKSMVECVVCLTMPRPDEEINVVCSEGHMVCGPCDYLLEFGPKAHHCPTCRRRRVPGQFTSPIVEAVVDLFVDVEEACRFNCGYKNYLGRIVAHERHCKEQLKICSPNWRGKTCGQLIPLKNTHECISEVLKPVSMNPPNLFLFRGVIEQREGENLFSRNDFLTWKPIALRHPTIQGFNIVFTAGRGKLDQPRTFWSFNVSCDRPLEEAHQIDVRIIVRILHNGKTFHHFGQMNTIRSLVLHRSNGNIRFVPVTHVNCLNVPNEHVALDYHYKGVFLVWYAVIHVPSHLLLNE